MTSLFEDDTSAVIGAQTEAAYRYRLSRRWHPDLPNKVLWLMCNPSSADAYQNDPTIRRVIALTKAIPEYWHQEFGGVEIVNLYSFRATHPKDLKAAGWPIGEGNDEIILQQAKSEEIGMIVAAWGMHPQAERVRAVEAMLKANGTKQLQCFGLCRDGNPRHPLMLLASATFRNYDGLPAMPVKPPKPEKPKTPWNHTWNPVAVYCEVWRSYYHRNPVIDGKDAGMLTKAAAGVKEPQFRKACELYLKDPNPSKLAIERGHDAYGLYVARNKFLAEAGA